MGNPESMADLAIFYKEVQSQRQRGHADEINQQWGVMQDWVMSQLLKAILNPVNEDEQIVRVRALSEFGKVFQDVSSHLPETGPDDLIQALADYLNSDEAADARKFVLMEAFKVASEINFRFRSPPTAE